MPALTCQTMSTSQENKTDTSSSGTTTSFTAYKSVSATSAAAAASIRNPSVLVSWILEHKSSPYPTKEEKKVLAKQAGMTITQVSYWFANTRRRIKKLGSWIVWEESQVHHKTPVIIPSQLGVNIFSDSFSTTGNLMDPTRNNTTPGSLYTGYPPYHYTYPGSLGSTGFHSFGNATSGIWNGSTSSSPFTPSPNNLDGAAFNLPPKSADGCLSSPQLVMHPHTPSSYSPSFQPFPNTACITPTTVTPLPLSAITSNASYKPPLYGPTTGKELLSIL